MSQIRTQTGPGYRFSIKTQVLQDYGVQTPVTGANPVIVVRRPRGLEVVSIGSDGRLHVLRRDAESATGWSARRLEQHADRLAAIRQKDGFEKVFFVTLEERNQKRTAHLFELVELDDGERYESRSRGSLETWDTRVYGLADLSGAQLSDGSNLLVTALAAYPKTCSNWAVVFRHGVGSGVLSVDSRAVTGDRIRLCEPDPAALPWPHAALVVLSGGELRIEWGVKDGPMMQTRTVLLPPLDGVVDFDVVRDENGRLRLFAVDVEHGLHTLTQVDAGPAEDGEPRPPAWAEVWTTLVDGEGPTLERVRAFRRGDGEGFDVFAIDHEDNLWYVSGEDVDRARRHPDGEFVVLRGLQTRAAQLTPVPRRDGLVEIVAVSRQNRVGRLWRRADGAWAREEIRWPVAARPAWLQIYRSGLTIIDESQDRVPGVPVEITATERLPMVVNGLAYTIGPTEPVVARTNPFGQINVTFEVNDSRRVVPSLSFSADFLAGVLNVSPTRKAQLYVPNASSSRLLESRQSSTEMFLVPENTLLKNC